MKSKVKKIIIFYDDGSFQEIEPNPLNNFFGHNTHIGPTVYGGGVGGVGGGPIAVAYDLQNTSEQM